MRKAGSTHSGNEYWNASGQSSWRILSWPRPAKTEAPETANAGLESKSAQMDGGTFGRCSLALFCLTRIRFKARAMYPHASRESECKRCHCSGNSLWNRNVPRPIISSSKRSSKVRQWQGHALFGLSPQRGVPATPPRRVRPT